MSSSAPQKDDEISRLRKELEALKPRGLTRKTNESSTLGQVGTFSKILFQTCKLAWRQRPLVMNLYQNDYYKENS